MGDHGCREARRRLPRASRRGDSCPRGREAGLGKCEPPLIVGRAERCHHDVALELGIDLDDAHREHGRRLIEEPVGCESGSCQRENPVRRLKSHAFVGDARRSSEEGQDVFRRGGIGEKELVRHTL